MFSHFLAIFVMFAAFGSGMSASCNMTCEIPFTQPSFWILPDNTAECDQYDTCGNNELNLCSQQNDTDIFVSFYGAAFKVFLDFCRNPDIESLKGADEPGCDFTKPEQCLIKADQAPNDRVRCLFVRETIDCIDDFRGSCEMKIFRDIIDSAKPTFEKIKTECKKKGLSVGDNAGSNVQATILTLLVSVTFVLFRNVLVYGSV